MQNHMDVRVFFSSPGGSLEPPQLHVAPSLINPSKILYLSLYISPICKFHTYVKKSW